MPLYEYQCTKCGERLEIIQRVSDPPHSHCPKCGGDMKKLLSSPAIQFKGSGFYKTDYASKKDSGGSGSKTAESKSESKGENKSDSGSGTGSPTSGD
jgi:putative FmdB family regulatory protein